MSKSSADYDPLDTIYRFLRGTMIFLLMWKHILRSFVLGFVIRQPFYTWSDYWDIAERDWEKAV